MDFFSDLRQCDLGTNYLDPGLNISEYTNIIHEATYVLPRNDQFAMGLGSIMNFKSSTITYF